MKFNKLEIPLTLGLAGVVICNLIAFNLKSTEWAVFFLLAGMTWLQACLDFYKGDSKPVFGAVARFTSLAGAAAILYMRGL